LRVRLSQRLGQIDAIAMPRQEKEMVILRVWEEKWESRGRGEEGWKSGGGEEERRPMREQREERTGKGKEGEESRRE